MLVLELLIRYVGLRTAMGRWELLSITDMAAKIERMLTKDEALKMLTIYTVLKLMREIKMLAWMLLTICVAVMMLLESICTCRLSLPENTFFPKSPERQFHLLQLDPHPLFGSSSHQSHRSSLQLLNHLGIHH